MLIIQPAAGDNVKVYNVVTFGAKPDGLTDSTTQFFSAWSAACNEKSPVMIVVPKGRYLLQPITFHGGDCSNSKRITFYVSGTLVAPLDFHVLGKTTTWLDFQWASNVSFIGGGTLDAKGSTLWDCKKAAGGDCPDGATVRVYMQCFFLSKKGTDAIALLHRII